MSSTKQPLETQQNEFLSSADSFGDPRKITLQQGLNMLGDRYLDLPPAIFVDTSTREIRRLIPTCPETADIEVNLGPIEPRSKFRTILRIGIQPSAEFIDNLIVPYVTRDDRFYLANRTTCKDAKIGLLNSDNLENNFRYFSSTDTRAIDIAGVIIFGYLALSGLVVFMCDLYSKSRPNDDAAARPNRYQPLPQPPSQRQIPSDRLDPHRYLNFNSVIADIATFQTNVDEGKLPDLPSESVKLIMAQRSNTDPDTPDLGQVLVDLFNTNAARDTPSASWVAMMPVLRTLLDSGLNQPLERQLNEHLSDEGRREQLPPDLVRLLATIPRYQIDPLRGFIVKAATRMPDLPASEILCELTVKATDFTTSDSDASLEIFPNCIRQDPIKFWGGYFSASEAIDRISRSLSPRDAVENAVNVMFEPPNRYMAIHRTAQGSNMVITQNKTLSDRQRLREIWINRNVRPSSDSQRLHDVDFKIYDFTKATHGYPALTVFNDLSPSHELFNQIPGFLKAKVVEGQFQPNDYRHSEIIGALMTRVVGPICEANPTIGGHMKHIIESAIRSNEKEVKIASSVHDSITIKSEINTFLLQPASLAGSATASQDTSLKLAGSATASQDTSLNFQLSNVIDEISACLSEPDKALFGYLIGVLAQAGILGFEYNHQNQSNELFYLGSYRVLKTLENSNVLTFSSRFFDEFEQGACIQSLMEHLKRENPWLDGVFEKRNSDRD